MGRQRRKEGEERNVHVTGNRKKRQRKKLRKEEERKWWKGMHGKTLENNSRNGCMCRRERKRKAKRVEEK